MCVDPVTAALVAVQVGGTIAGGHAASAASKQSAANLRQQGIMEARSAADQAGDIRYEGERFLGATRAAQAASGVALDSGSAADVGAESAANIEMDALRALYGGRVRKWQLDYEADVERYNGKVAKTQAYIEAGATLLGNAIKGMGQTPPGAKPDINTNYQSASPQTIYRSMR